MVPTVPKSSGLSKRHRLSLIFFGEDSSPYKSFFSNLGADYMSRTSQLAGLTRVTNIFSRPQKKI